MLVGAALAERIIGRRIGLAAFGTAAIMGATMLLIGLAPVSLVIVAIAFIVGGGANSVHNVAVRTLLQSECPPADPGQVARSEERRGGKEGVSTFRSRGSPDH